MDSICDLGLLLNREKSYKGSHTIHLAVNMKPEDITLKLQIQLSYDRSALLLVNTKKMRNKVIGFDRIIGPYNLGFDPRNSANKQKFTSFLACLVPYNKLKHVKIKPFKAFIDKLNNKQ